MFGDFHFIQPLWLLALPPLAFLLWWLRHREHGENPWRRIVDSSLLPLLLDERNGKRARLPVRLLAAGWLLAVLALADPTWERQPQPLRQTESARVIVLDLSRSMLARDLKPSRLVRARFKVEDLLAFDEEGQTGLVVFAGDAFSVSPLTRDTETIRAQLKALDPSIMPSQGSRADLGLLKALELLKQAGVDSGQVILIADGVEGDRATGAAARLQAAGYTVSVLGIGTDEGAPIPDNRGGRLRDPLGKPVLARLDESALAAVAHAGEGRFTRLSGDSSDIAYLLGNRPATGEAQPVDQLQAQKWKEQGPLLVLLLLPLAALAFRRGWLLLALLSVGTFIPPRPAMAFGWEDLWQRQDQRAAQALQQGDYEQAEKLADDPARRGSAHYRQGDFENAVRDFGATPGADAAYNRGNALARLGRYRDAISAYDKALETRPGMEDAQANRAAVEALLTQQQRSKQQQDRNASSNGQEKQEQSPSQDKNASEGRASDDRQRETQGAQQEPSDGEGADENGSQQRPNPSSGGPSQNDPQEGDTGNRFADANGQLDSGKNRPQAETTGDSGQPEQDGQQTAYRGREEGRSQNRPERSQTPEQSSGAGTLSDEERLAAQQWLRRIPDDPGGLLRRKFLYQYRQRPRPPGNGQDW